jgi:hypothetical protein
MAIELPCVCATLALDCEGMGQLVLRDVRVSHPLVDCRALGLSTDQKRARDCCRPMGEDYRIPHSDITWE